MATITPHRDAVEQGLDVKRARVNAGRTDTETGELYCDLTIGLVEVAMRALCDSRDRDVGDPVIGGAMVGALGNLFASVSETIATGEPAKYRGVLHVSITGAAGHALRAIDLPDVKTMNEVRSTSHRWDAPDDVPQLQQAVRFTALV